MIFDGTDPDKNLDNSEVAAEMFRKVNRANQVLSDEKKREIYDKHGMHGLQLFEQFGEEGLVMQVIHAFYCYMAGCRDGVIKDYTCSIYIYCIYMHFEIAFVRKFHVTHFYPITIVRRLFMSAFIYNIPLRILCIAW